MQNQTFSIKIMNQTKVAKGLITCLCLVVATLLGMALDREHAGIYIYLSGFIVLGFMLHYYFFNSFFIDAKTVEMSSDKLVIRGQETQIISIGDIKTYTVFKILRSPIITVSITLHNNEIIALNGNLDSGITNFADAFDQMMKSRGK